MPTFQGDTPSNYYKRLLQINQSSNTAPDATTRNVQGGDATSTSISLSDDVLKVQPITDNTTGTFLVNNQSGNSILNVDTSSSLVKAGASQVNALTLFKDMGLYDFSPTAGYHNPLIANNMMSSNLGHLIMEDQSMFSNGTDPATTLDISTNGTERGGVACYWYLENNITLDSIRYMTTTDGSDTIEFHLYAYTLDVSSNHGDLSAGTLHAHVHSVTSDVNTIRTGTLTLDTADIDASKVVIGFVESDSTTDITCSLNIKYHIR